MKTSIGYSVTPDTSSFQRGVSAFCNFISIVSMFLKQRNLTSDLRKSRKGLDMKMC